MPVPLANVGVAFELITRDFDRMIDALGEDAIVANIYNDAASEDGVYYWKIVDQGRGPVVPVHAQVLHWKDPKTGKDVFAKYSRASAPRHILGNSIPAIQQFSVQGDFRDLNRETLIRFVNAVAEKAVEELIKNTPSVTGKLRSSYRIESAE